jgi:transposase
MVLAVVIDGQGRPICTEMVAGNTADLTVLLPILDRLRDHFKVGRVCVAADRGMISAASIAAVEARKLKYILAARERSSAIVRDLVMNDEQPFTPLLVERVKGETQVFVKQLKLSGQRYIVCRNQAEAGKDKADRQAIVEGLQKQLKKGDRR